MTTRPDQPRQPAAVRALARAWFDLTRDERHAVLIVLGLFLLGLAARCFRIGWPTPADPPSSSAPAPAAAHAVPSK